jgi:hypothetical protein
MSHHNAPGITIANVQSTVQQNHIISEFLELDSHADTCCIGSNCRIIAYTDKVCEVSQYHPEYQPIMNVPIVQAGTAYDDPITGKTYILVINQGLYLEKMLPQTLLNPNQMRFNGLTVDDCPKHLAPDPNNATHSIYVPQHNLRLPLKMKGMLSCLPVRLPTAEKIETCQWVELTSQA